MIDEAIRRGDIKLAPASEKHVKMANDVQNDFYNKLIGLGMNEQEALSASILMKNFALKRTVSPERFKDWYDKIVVTNKPQSQVGAVMQNALHQSAMYKSPKQNFSDFYNQVFEKEKDTKENNTNLNKSYFEYNDENTNIRVPHDTIVHDNNKHNLSSSEWETLFNNLTNPSLAVLSNKPRFNGTPVLLKYNIANKSYGVVVEFFENKKPIITTAFTDKEKNIDNWLKKNSHSQAKNTSSVTTKGMLLSNDYTNIINYVKEKLNPNVNNHEEGIYVNGKFIDFDWLEEKLYALNKLAKNLRPEGELQENYDGWTVSYKNDKNAKERKHLYNLKNKLIDKYGTFTGNIHKFPKGYGIEYSINGKGSFHKFVEDFITVKKYTLEQAIKKLSNREKENFKFSFDYDGDLVINKKNGVKYLNSDDIKEIFRKNNIEFDFEKYSNKLNIDYINNDIKNIEKLDVEKLLEVKKELTKEYIEKANYYEKEIKKQKEKLSKIPKTRKKTIEKEKQELYLLEKRFDYYNNQDANKTINKLLEIKNQAIKTSEQLKEINSMYKKLKKNGYISQNNELKELSQISKENKRNINLTSDDMKQLEELYDNDYILGRLNKHDIRYQQENSSVAPGAIEETIQDKFGCSVEELTENIKQDIISTLSDYDVSDSEFSIQDIKLYGSYSKGTNKATSDLDFIVQYDGSMREDSAFNILHDVEHTIEDKDGNKVLIDINPINVNESGTIDEHVEYMNSLDDDNNTYFQSAYHGTPHKFDEFSLDAIGTGEGAQAHGWGLYFAGNKDVSENYRKELARINNLDLFGPVPVDVYYDGKHATEYNPSADFSLALELVGTQDKKAGIDYLKNEINKCQKRIDEFKEDMKQRPMDIPAFKQQIEDEQDYISELNKQIDFINNLDVNKLEVEKRNQGQLFEVDIPENDALLDEDKELIHQPDKVQRVIEKIYADAMKSNNVELTNAIGITGKEIYRGFSKYFGSDKKASEFLNSYGIKGITYDGRQDGRCYVIFDDKAVNVIKTYYQSMLSGIDKDQKVNVLDLTSAFGSDANLSKKDLTNYIKSLIGSNPISTSDKNAIVNFIARSKRTGKGNVYIPSHIANSSKVETNNKGVRNTVVNNIVDLIKNSVLIDKSENRDKQTKPNVDYYYRCYVPVRVNNDIYTVRVTLENNEKDNLFNIINGNVYDVIIDKKMTSAHSMTNSQSSLMKSSSNSNIPQNNKNVTSDQITIEDMLKDVLDAEGNTYYQSDSEDVIREKLSNENIQNKIDELSQRIEKLAEEESELDNSLLI